MNSHDNNFGKVLYNLQRFQILQTKLNPSTTDTLPNAYVYAWESNLYPVMHQSSLHEDLKDQFLISEEQVDAIC